MTCRRWGGASPRGLDRGTAVTWPQFWAGRSQVSRDGYHVLPAWGGDWPQIQIQKQARKFWGRNSPPALSSRLCQDRVGIPTFQLRGDECPQRAPAHPPPLRMSPEVWFQMTCAFLCAFPSLSLPPSLFFPFALTPAAHPYSRGLGFGEGGGWSQEAGLAGGAAFSSPYETWNESLKRNPQVWRKMGAGPAGRESADTMELREAPSPL